MKVSAGVIRKLNTELGTTGQPHLILVNGEWVDTGCVYWPTPVDWRTSANPTQAVDTMLAKVRGLLVYDPVIAYKGEFSWMSIDTTTAGRIVVAPTTNQFDILRFEQTNGANYGLLTEDIINELVELDNKYGIDITGAGFDAVEFFLKRTPKGKEADQLGKWLLGFCPDIYEAPTNFSEGRVALWWD